ncbi:MAG: PEP-CTERM system histidine kinase PrsK, partial [Acetobacteraceae bacterium]|nr:PEP-CTERM system histidine kinase PrsK [Acetobacteraceae bacterium]
MIAELAKIAWLHAACAVVYVALAVIVLLRSWPNRAGLWFAGACVVTCAWAGVVALDADHAEGGLAGWLEIARSVAWYGFILHLYRRCVARDKQLGQAFATTGLLLALMAGLMPLIDLLSSRHAISLWSFGTAARLGVAICNILLIENLYFNTPEDRRWHVNLLCIALGGIFLYDLVLYSDAVLFRRVSPVLFEGRASVTAIAALLLGSSVLRNRRWAASLQVSRTVVFHSATLIASGVFLIGLAAAGEMFREAGAGWGYVAEVTLISAGLLTIAVLLTSGSARAHLRFLIVDHFFSHRYDYRVEWMRCITTLSAPENYTSLQTRAIRAVAEVVDSPAGALFVRDPEGAAFQWAGSWNMSALATPVGRDDALIGQFRDGNWIVELDKAHGVPDWTAALPRSWLAVPLSHLGCLIGFVVLAQSRAGFELDREVYNLLRIVGHEVANYVAEQRATQVLSETRHLQEYSKRFAFVIHDIKNVSSQLSMLLSNAEVHADNPEFQRDMLNTVRASVGKITRTLARLQTHEREQARVVLVPLECLTELAVGYRRVRRVSVSVDHDGRSATVAMDQGSFEAVISHLLDNAIEASGGRPVRIRLRHEAMSVLIEIMDQG